MLLCLRHRREIWGSANVLFLPIQSFTDSESLVHSVKYFNHPSEAYIDSRLQYMVVKSLWRRFLLWIRLIYCVDSFRKRWMVVVTNVRAVGIMDTLGTVLGYLQLHCMDNDPFFHWDPFFSGNNSILSRYFDRMNKRMMSSQQHSMLDNLIFGVLQQN